MTINKIFRRKKTITVWEESQTITCNNYRLQLKIGCSCCLKYVELHSFHSTFFESHTSIGHNNLTTTMKQNTNIKNHTHTHTHAQIHSHTRTHTKIHCQCCTVMLVNSLQSNHSTTHTHACMCTRVQTRTHADTHDSIQKQINQLNRPVLKITTTISVAQQCLRIPCSPTTALG